MPQQPPPRNTSPQATFAFFGKQLTLAQHPTLPRPTEDALWLAAALPLPAAPAGDNNPAASAASSATYADFGCGSGAVSLALLHRCRQQGTSAATITGYDIHPQAVNWAQHNATLNPFVGTGIFTPVLHNVCTLPQNLSFSCCFANPPFHTTNKGFLSPKAYKNAAHGSSLHHIKQWLNALWHHTAPGGYMVAIHHHQHLPLLLQQWQQASALWVVMVHSKKPHSTSQTCDNTPVKRTLVVAQKPAMPQQNATAAPPPLNFFTIETYQPHIRQAVLYNGDSLWQHVSPSPPPFQAATTPAPLSTALPAMLPTTLCPN